MIFWNNLLTQLRAAKKTALLYVLNSEGSSPGRQGFKMFVSEDGKMDGSIGGGIMEHKLVELVKALMEKGESGIFYKAQIHRKNSPTNQSGMICSGEQEIAILLPGSYEHVVEKIVEKGKGQLKISPDSIHFNSSIFPENPFHFAFENEKQWSYQEAVGFQAMLSIFGGGHVSLALSELMSALNFQVQVIDDRPELFTMQQNDFATKKITADYQNIASLIPENLYHYVVLMTFGYRSDKIVLKQLLNKKLAYLGMMGSQTKVDKLYAELIEEGIEKKVLDKIYSPIGIQISSKTPMEIAVSIAAEIIQIKNSN